MQQVYLLDTFGMLFKSYYALPPLKNRDDFPTGVITGFFKTLLYYRKNIDISNLIFVYEGGGKNFRKELSTDYKKDRGEIPDDFRLQFEVLKDLIEKMGFKSFSVDGFEADDVIATLSEKFSQNSQKVSILSADKDFNQLINENVTIYKPDKLQRFDRDEVFDKFGVYPEQFIDYQALVGDAVDGVSGVRGIGKVTASKLLSEFGTLENIYANLHQTSKGNAKKLETGREDAIKSKELVTLKKDLDVSIENFRNSEREPFLNIVEELLKYEISDPIKFLKKEGLLKSSELEDKDENNFKFEHKIISEIGELKDILSKIETGKIVAFDTETTGVSSLSDSIVGISFADEVERGYYIPINHQASFFDSHEQISISELQNVISEFNRFKLVGHNWKFDSNIIWNNFGIALDFYADTMVMAWLDDTRESISLDNLSYKFLKHKMIKFKDIVKKGENFSSVEIGVAGKYAVEDSVATLRLFEIFSDKNQKLFELENRITKILSKMEREGISVDLKYLEKLRIDFEKEIEEISANIFGITKREFNLNSPKQVAETLFDIVGMEETKKRSTDEANLKLLLQKNSSVPERVSILENILKYREVKKLLSTYVIPLMEKSVDSRIHTNFVQTGTATGRLSSREPNLQNIPVGNRIRRAFIAKDGYSLLSLDYSQIELRLLAHFSGDEQLVENFQNGVDVHGYLAEKLKIKRSTAKTVNFGVLYGMGSMKLSKTLDIPKDEASKIIENFFEIYSGVKEFNQPENYLSEEGNSFFVETLFGRTRYFDFPKNGKEESELYRESFNTIFQGSASDLIKEAMIQIDSEISEKNLDVKMLLQIHDELIFEVKDEILDEVKNRFSEIMENCYKLKVPLEVNSKFGKSWE
ncbi:DNA polymerase I [Thiovulum sp. ES]|nr:DNA polymerase I [Thiovulum sp. ES]